MNTQSVYRSQHPDVLATVREYKTATQAWRQRVTALLPTLGLIDRSLIVSDGINSRVLGVEYRHGDRQDPATRMAGSRTPRHHRAATQHATTRRPVDRGRAGCSAAPPPRATGRPMSTATQQEGEAR